jgi:hypothetical protein
MGCTTWTTLIGFGMDLLLLYFAILASFSELDESLSDIAQCEINLIKIDHFLNFSAQQRY